MSHNDLHPMWIELQYAVGTRLHVKRIPVLPYSGGVPTPGLDPADYSLLRKDNGEITFDVAVDEMMAVISPLFHTSVNFSIADLWYKSSIDADPVWLCVYEVGQTGDSVTTPTTDGQLVMSHRTVGGGKYMDYFMESSYAVNLKDDFPFGTVNWTNYGNYVKGISSVVRGRDSTAIAANKRVTTKTNDALRKRRLLDA